MKLATYVPPTKGVRSEQILLCALHGRPCLTTQGVYATVGTGSKINFRVRVRVRVQQTVKSARSSKFHLSHDR